jgi:hypothetical protein
MEDEDAVKAAKDDAEFVRDQVVSEFETFMEFPMSLELLRSKDLDGLLCAFGELLQWMHRVDSQPQDDGR